MSKTKREDEPKAMVKTFRQSTKEIMRSLGKKACSLIQVCVVLF